MDFLSASGPSIYKRQAMKDAELQQKSTDEKLAKLGRQPTGYQFTELIGKGAYGRVYKRYVMITLYPWKSSGDGPAAAADHSWIPFQGLRGSQGTTAESPPVTLAGITNGANFAKSVTPC